MSDQPEVPTIEQIKAMVASLGPVTPAGTIIDEGHLSAKDGGKVPYALYEGWDIVTANSADETWGAFNVKLMRHISQQGYAEAQLKEVLDGIQIDDSHWRWLNKSLAFQSGEYRWFFLMAEGYPQAACLIYHPKPSAYTGNGIYYIEFIAVAPWNRKNPMMQRAFDGVGTLLIRKVCSYAQNVLGLKPGFSLHALPKASGYYVSIGMEPFPDLDKGGLSYFEMPEAKCQGLMA